MTVLEGAGEAVPPATVGGPARDVAALELDRAVRGTVEPAEHVELAEHLETASPS